ncbi:hypothetical protein [Kitasatospora sp. NPDC088783]|uniref:hypothetical protein n=1 Tax=Kitasatospora sp. NPDC088783 TaxID=3364077 RepID=UPI0037F40736
MSHPLERQGSLVDAVSIAELAQLVGGVAHTVHPDVDVEVRPVFTAVQRPPVPGGVCVVLPGTPRREAIAAAEAACAGGAGAVLLEGTAPVPGVPTVTVASVWAALWKAAAWTAGRYAPASAHGAVVLVMGGRGLSTALRVCQRMFDEESHTLVAADTQLPADLALPMTLTQVADQGPQIALYEAPGRQVATAQAAAALTLPDVLVVLPDSDLLPRAANSGSVRDQVLAITREMRPDQVVVLCTDDLTLRELAGRIRGPQVVTVSTIDSGASVHVADFHHILSAKATITWAGHTATATLPVAGSSAGLSAVAGFAGFLAAKGLTTPDAALTVDRDGFKDLIGRLYYANPCEVGRMWRGNLPGRGLLVDDTGTCALPDLLAATEALPLHAGRHRELCAIVGELDVGPGADPLDVHALAGAALAAAGVRRLAVVTGPDAHMTTGAAQTQANLRALLSAATDTGVQHAELLSATAPAALDRFLDTLPTGCAVLLKGLGLNSLRPRLIAHFTARATEL